MIGAFFILSSFFDEEEGIQTNIPHHLRQRILKKVDDSVGSV